MSVEFLGIAPWAVISAAGTWGLTMLAHKREMRKIELDHSAQVDGSRDDLAIELLSSARAEVVTARSEMTALRDEINALRAMEQHFYHFQQALEHLSAVLFARDRKSRGHAERNARAFLTRMERLKQAKGTIANEAQRVDSSLSAVEREIRKEGGQA
jgi:hypothetical protein